MCSVPSVVKRLLIPVFYRAASDAPTSNPMVADMLASSTPLNCETMKHLLIVAHAPSPNTLKLRDAAARGAGHEDIENVSVIVKAPLDAGPDDVMACDAILLGTTENLGYMSGALKDFFDRTYYAVLEEKQGLPCALYIRAGHDGTGTRLS